MTISTRQSPRDDERKGMKTHLGRSNARKINFDAGFALEKSSKERNRERAWPMEHCFVVCAAVDGMCAYVRA